MNPCPCKKGGIDCPKRYLGCHSECKEYQEWSEERAEMNKRRKADREYAECHSRQALNALWRKKKKERRR